MNRVQVPIVSSEHDPTTIWRNRGASSQSRRIRQLQPIRAVGSAAPERVIRVREIRYPSTVSRERGCSRRYSRQERSELFGLEIIVNEFRLLQTSHSKNTLSVETRGYA